MAAKNFMSNILDELMGRNRDALPTEVPKEVQWDDPEICPYYLVAFCPHELFVNTKADLGSCSKFHDDILRKKYMEEAPAYKRSQFEREFIRFAEKMISDIEGKIKRGKMRIALANGPDGLYAGPGSKNAEKISLLSERMNALLEEAEAAGCEGDVEKAQGIMKLCDQIKEERDQMRSSETNLPWNPDKAMQVCEVCGSYLIIGEAQHRLDDHIMGKQHVGFAMLRKSLEDVKKAVEKRDVEEREQMEKERELRLGNRERPEAPNDSIRRKDDKDRDSRRDRDRRDRDRDRKRYRSRSRDKDRSKGKDRSRDKERDKDKSRDRKGDSSRDKKRHSDDKKRSKRSRSRSKSKRSRSGSKNKRSRSRSKTKRSRSRSKSKRSRSRSHDRKKKDRHSRRHHRDRDEEKGKDKHEDASEKVENSVKVDADALSHPASPEKLQQIDDQCVDHTDVSLRVKEEKASGKESPSPGSV